MIQYNRSKKEKRYLIMTEKDNIVASCWVRVCSDEERTIAEKVLEEYRAEKRRIEKIEMARQSLGALVGAMVNEIGLEETKTLMRESARALRELKF